MNDEENKETKEGEVITKEQSASELDAISALLQGVVTPFAQAQWSYTVTRTVIVREGTLISYSKLRRWS